MSRRLLVLAAGAFAIGTDGFLIAGLLPQIADTYGVSGSAAGQLITVFAVAYAVGSPLLAVATGRVERRRLLVMVLGCFAAANVLGAAAPSYLLLLVARVVAALTAAAFMPSASAIAAMTSAPVRRGRALATVTGGLTVAVALGVPLGTLLGGLAGWRASLLFVAAVSLIVALGVRVMLPAVPAPPPAGLGVRLAVLRRPAILRIVLPTIVYFTAGFTVFTYIAVVVHQSAGLTPAGLSALLLGFGVAAIAGNALGGMSTDRNGPRRTLLAALTGLSAALAVLAVATAAVAGNPSGVALTMLAVLGWGVAGWAVNAPQQVLLVAGAPDQPPVALSLSGSANYVGIALGGALGGVVLQEADVTAVTLTGAGLALAAALLVAATVHPASSRHSDEPGSQYGGGGAMEPPTHGTAASTRPRPLADLD